MVSTEAVPKDLKDEQNPPISLVFLGKSKPETHGLYIVFTIICVFSINVPVNQSNDNMCTVWYSMGQESNTMTTTTSLVALLAPTSNIHKVVPHSSLILCLTKTTIRR